MIAVVVDGIQFSVVGTERKVAMKHCVVDVLGPRLAFSREVKTTKGNRVELDMSQKRDRGTIND